MNLTAQQIIDINHELKISLKDYNLKGLMCEYATRIIKARRLLGLLNDQFNATGVPIEPNLSIAGELK